MSLSKTLLKATETTSTLPVVIISVVSQIAALAVGFGAFDSVQKGVIISATTAAVNAGAWIAHAFHTGKINPKSLQTYIIALVVQIGALAVAFGLVKTSTAAEWTSISTAVLTTIGQIAVSVKSLKIPVIS